MTMQMPTDPAQVLEWVVGLLNIPGQTNEQYEQGNLTYDQLTRQAQTIGSCSCAGLQASAQVLQAPNQMQTRLVTAGTCRTARGIAMQ